jgi:hypothetical protein
MTARPPLISDTTPAEEVITDSGFNFLLMAYETGRLSDKGPTFMEIRIGRRAHRGVPYIRVTAPKPR